ncbi:LuxR C-terminal-related transcriptional regulator [Hyalangium gracile]|uniref:LuxR C-terminal-related transcriptional regulator n=1 Tax=Hyalangium gracile TaxID=394092 RepID=UPI001CCE8B89|nr:response regulator transcription factor [Hyalangium gracile]
MREPVIAILSDQNLFREGLVQLLQSQGFHRVAEYRSAAELLGALTTSPPRLVLIDMDHGTDDPFPLLREFRHRAPRTTVVIIGTALQSGAAHANADAVLEMPSADAQVLRAVANLALAADQAGPVPPPSAEALHQRKLWSTLTPRQRDVLGFLSTGSDNLKIAANLGISERAVKAHVSALLSLFNAENRTELAVLACRAGMRPPIRTRPEPVPVAEPRTV